MPVRYFRKLVPQTKVVLGNGSLVDFTTNDGLVGYFSTDNTYLQDEFCRFMREQRYGISEIPEAEFHVEYTQKKTQLTISAKPWRDEMVGTSSRSGYNPVAALGS